MLPILLYDKKLSTFYSEFHVEKTHSLLCRTNIFIRRVAVFEVFNVKEPKKNTPSRTIFTSEFCRMISAVRAYDYRQKKYFIVTDMKCDFYFQSLLLL